MGMTTNAFTKSELRDEIGEHIDHDVAATGYRISLDVAWRHYEQHPELDGWSDGEFSGPAAFFINEDGPWWVAA